MAHIVYTRIDSLEDLPAAVWRPGDNSSYEATKRMTGAHLGGPEIHLIGRQAKDGSVQLCYACRRGGEWRAVSAWHLTLAKFFAAKLRQAPESLCLRAFFDRIDDAAAENAARQLVFTEVGTNVEYEPFNRAHSAILTVLAAVECFGIPCGDWAFIPMRNTIYGQPA